MWTVALDPTVADEQRGTRPCLVVSADRFNALPIRQAIVVPLTTRDRGFPHHVGLRHDGGFTRASWAMREGVRTVSTERFGQLIGTVEQRRWTPCSTNSPDGSGDEATARRIDLRMATTAHSRARIRKRCVRDAILVAQRAGSSAAAG
ncbi:MAG: type II toxin-antitoxin system PemK/MazF family toxin [Mycobacteriales bacterium]